MQLLKQCTGKGYKLRKIFFTPCLEKERCDSWISKQLKDKNWKVAEKIEGVTRWYNEDLENSADHVGKPPLYSKLKKFLDKPNQSIPEETYKRYSPLIVAIGSMDVQRIQHVITADKDTDELIIILDQAKLTESVAVHKSAKFVYYQKPLEEQPMAEKVLLFSPRQMKIVKGPNRQVIFGAAGTGKTVVVEAKIRELLERGDSICVFSPESYAWKYQEHFAQYIEAGKLKTERWSMTLSYEMMKDIFGNSLFDEILKESTSMFEEWRGRARLALCSPVAHDGKNLLCSLLSAVEQLAENPFQAFYKFLDDKINDDLRARFKKLFEGAHLIIDDGLDDDFGKSSKPQNFIVYVSFLMKLAALSTPDRVIWLASDPYKGPVSQYGNQSSLTSRLIDMLVLSLVENELKRISKERDHFYDVTLLNEVMQCTQSVYSAVYADWSGGQFWLGRQNLGHKVLGGATNTIKITSDDSQDHQM